MAEHRETGVGVDAGTALSAEVIHDAPATITMYFKGIPTQVPASEIGTFQAHGFLLHQPEDLTALCDESDQLAAEVTRTARAFVADLLEKKQIGNDEQSTVKALQGAMVRLNGRLQDILTIAAENYPVTERGETPDEFVYRVAAEAVWNHYPPEEITRRYGLYGQDAVVARITALLAEMPGAPTTEPHVQLEESGEWVPASQATGPIIAHAHGKPEEAS